MAIYLNAPPQTGDVYQWLNYLNQRLNLGLSFSVNKNAANQSLTTATPTALTWSTIETDSTAAFSTSTGKWTCKDNGTYEFHASARLLASFGPAALFTISIYKNGVEVAQSNTNAVNTSVANPVIQVSRILNLAVGDYIQVYCSQNTGSTQSVDGGTKFTYFSGKRVT